MAGHHHHTHPGLEHAAVEARRHSGLAWALGLTLGYAAVEFLAGLAFGSLALVSDAGHMLSDASALGLAWIAASLARRPPGARHTFGFARAEVVAAFVNGLALLLIVVWIVAEAVRRLLQPSAVEGLGVMIVAFVGLVVNLVVAGMLSRVERTLNVRAALLHVISDVLGSVAALAAGAVIYLTDWSPIDPLLSLGIALLILYSTIRLVKDALHVLMEGVPHSIALREVVAALTHIAGVVRVHDLHVWNISSNRAALSAHLELTSMEQWPQVLQECRTTLLARFGIEHVTLQPELIRHAPERAVIKVFARR